MEVVDTKKEKEIVRKAKKSMKKLGKNISNLEKVTLKVSLYTGNIAIVAYFIFMAGKWLMSTIGSIVVATSFTGIIATTVISYQGKQSIIPAEMTFPLFIIRKLPTYETPIKVYKRKKQVYKEKIYNKIIVDEGNGIFAIKEMK